MSELRGLCDENTITQGDFVTTAGTVYPDKHSKIPLDYVDYGDEDSFVSGLRNLHERVIPAKEEAGLLSPAFFDPDMSDDTCRGLANIRLLRGIWLDNDGGDLSHGEFARLFPRYRIVAFNTYSSTPENPRWRAFIPTTEAMAISVHKLILAQIIKVLNAEGYWTEAELEKKPGIKSRLVHGFDLTKLAASSMFYLPAQARHPEGSFLVDYSGGNRGPIKPGTMINNSIVHSKPVPDVPARTKPAARPAPVAMPNLSPRMRTMQAKLWEQMCDAANSKRLIAQQQAIEAWRDIACHAGVGHHEFFRLGAALQRSGMDRFELQSTLDAEAGWARNPGERRGEVRSMIRKLTS